MANTYINERETYIELKLHMKTLPNIPLRNKLYNFKGFQEKPRRKTRAVWTEERK